MRQIIPVRQPRTEGEKDSGEPWDKEGEKDSGEPWDKEE
jgi:hypothetical protein